jgi:hypothetical protein
MRGDSLPFAHASPKRDSTPGNAADQHANAQTTKHATRPWVSLLRAAEYLSEPAESLRKKIERAARGRSEAHFDGVYARKFGRLWKLHLGDWHR